MSVFRRALFHLNEKSMKGCTWHVYDELLENELLTFEQMQELQWTKLEKMIRHAYETVPYYRETWKKQGIHPKEIRHFDDFIQKIPVINKKDVKQQTARFFSERPQPGLYRVDTSGSTGNPGTFYQDGLSRSFGLASRYRGRQWWGVTPVDNEIRLWGRSAIFSDSFKVRTKDKVKRIKDRLVGIRYLPTFNMREENLEKWLKVVRHHHPKVILGYSSAIFAFSRFLQHKNIDLRDSGIKVVTHTSEHFYTNQKEVVARYFCPNIASEYGAVENGIIAFECPQGSLHVMDDNVFLETLTVSEEKNQFTVTNLENLSFPLIRYNTQDTGRFMSTPCVCGRPLHSIRLDQGRMFDAILNSRGDLIDGVSLDHAIARPLGNEHGCRRFQAIQVAVDRLDIFVETSASVSEAGKQKVINNVQEFFGEKITVNIFETDHLETEQSGKFKFIISRLSQ